MKYEFVPFPQRKPLRWPNGKRLAVMITTNLEYWDATKDTPKPFYPGGPGIVGGDLPGNVYDNPNYTWREYGQRVGVWRMFDIFDEFGVPSTCTMNAKMGLERRAVIDAALKRGWEIVAHNYVQTELLADYSFDETKEREVIRETLRVYKEVCGKPAKGWLSSSLRCTLNTVDILAEEGLIFTTDLLNDDQPYLIETRSGKTMVSIPYTSEVNDFTVFMRQGQDVNGAFAVFKEQFDWLYQESAKSGRFMNVGLHPHVVGQPFRIRALRDFVAYCQAIRRRLVRHPRGDRRVVSQKPSHPHRVMNIDAPLATARPGDPERRARQLRSLIERSAPAIERDRALPQELLAALFDAGLFKMLLPRSCGGEESDPVTFVTAVEEIAKADASTAWCVAQASGCSMAAAYIEPAVAQEIFGRQRCRCRLGPGRADGKSDRCRRWVSRHRDMVLRQR